MPANVCPKCKFLLSPDEVAEGLCPECRVFLPTDGQDASSLPTARDATPPDAPRWRTTRLGVGALFWSALAWALTLLVTGALLFLDEGGLVSNAKDVSGIVFAISPVVLLGGGVALVLYVAGLFCCCTVPEESGAKNAAIWALLLGFLFAALVALAALVVTVVPAQGPRRGESSPIAEVIVFGVISACLHSLMVCLSLRAMALHWKARELGLGFVFYFLLTTVVPLAVTVSSFLLRDEKPAPTQKVNVTGELLWSFGVELLARSWMMYLLARLWFEIPRAKRTAQVQAETRPTRP